MKKAALFLISLIFLAGCTKQVIREDVDQEAYTIGPNAKKIQLINEKEVKKEKPVLKTVRKPVPAPVPKEAGKTDRTVIPEPRASNKNFVDYTIKRGDTLSDVLMAQYGMYMKHNILKIVCAYNNIDLNKANNIHVGSKIMLPVILLTDGSKIYPKNAREKKWVVKKEPELKGEPGKAPEWGESTPPEPDETDKFKADVERLFSEGDFQAVIDASIERLRINPKDETAKEYLCKSLNRLGIEQFTEEKYLQAIEYFRNSLKYDRDCDQSLPYIRKAIEKTAFSRFPKTKFDNIVKKDEKEYIQYSTPEALQEEIERIENTISDLVKIEDSLPEKHLTDKYIRDLYYCMGVIYSDNARFQEADSALKKAAGLDPDDRKIQLYLKKNTTRWE